MRDLAPLIARLSNARARLESAARAVPGELWRKPPRPGAWSAAEVIAHLTMVEERVTDGATRLVSGPPRPVPHWKRLHLPVWLAGWRVLRAKTPIPLDSSLVEEREAMLARLVEVRRRTLALLEEHRERELSAYRLEHPFLGSLNFYSWFEMIAHHEARHTKQIREIVEVFQK